MDLSDIRVRRVRFLDYKSLELLIKNCTRLINHFVTQYTMPILYTLYVILFSFIQLIVLGKELIEFYTIPLLYIIYTFLFMVVLSVYPFMLFKAYFVNKYSDRLNKLMNEIYNWVRGDKTYPGNKGSRRYMVPYKTALLITIFTVMISQLYLVKNILDWINLTNQYTDNNVDKSIVINYIDNINLLSTSNLVYLVIVLMGFIVYLIVITRSSTVVGIPGKRILLFNLFNIILYFTVYSSSTSIILDSIQRGSVSITGYFLVLLIMVLSIVLYRKMMNYVKTIMYNTSIFQDNVQPVIQLLERGDIMAIRDKESKNMYIRVIYNPLVTCKKSIIMVYIRRIHDGIRKTELLIEPLYNDKKINVYHEEIGRLRSSRAEELYGVRFETSSKIITTSFYVEPRVKNDIPRHEWLRLQFRSGLAYRFTRSFIKMHNMIVVMALILGIISFITFLGALDIIYMYLFFTAFITYLIAGLLIGSRVKPIDLDFLVVPRCIGDN